MREPTNKLWQSHGEGRTGMGWGKGGSGWGAGWKSLNGGAKKEMDFEERVYDLEASINKK